MLSDIVAGLDVGCDHFRSVEYFMESIEEDKMFSAFRCDSFDDFKDGMCLTSSRLQNMGQDWQKQNFAKGRRYFTVTRKEDPFSGELSRNFNHAIRKTIEMIYYKKYFRQTS